jgi:hypothetical protein
VADLSALSMEDLVALKSGDLSKVSTAGLQALRGTQPSAAERVANDPITRGAQDVANVSPAALIAGSAPGRFLLQPARGLMELGSHLGLPGGESQRATEALINEGRAAYDNKGMDIAGIAGQVASPAVLKAAKLAPAIVQGAKLLPRMAQSAIVGATAGATTPTAEKGDFWTEKGMQTGGGAALGGALPAGGAFLRGLLGSAYKAVEPILPWGPSDILNRFQTGLLGPARDKVVAALEAAREIVPGSKPTAGEAIASLPEATGLAAHQRIVSKSPVAAPGFAVRTQEQEAARAAALGDVAKTPADVTAAENARAAVAAKNYGEAFKQATVADPALAKLAENPYFKDAMPDAIKLAQANGINAKDNLTQFLHYVKVGLDKQLTRTGDTALAETEKQSVQSVKGKLVEWLAKKNPAYETARQDFSKMSEPINTMQVAQHLQDKLAAPLAPIERASAFGQAVRDAPGTVARATGYEGAQTLPEPVAKVATALMGDLGRRAQFERLARGTNLSGSGMTPESPLPNLLSRPAMAANWVARKLGHNLEDKVNAVAGQQYLNPAQLAATLKDVPPSARQRVVEALMQHLGLPIVAGAPSAAMAQQF